MTLAPLCIPKLDLVGHPNQGDSHRSKSRPSAPSKRRCRLPEVQGPDGSLAGALTVVARGNAPTTPARSSPSKHPPKQGAAAGLPSVSAPRVGTATRVAQWREPEQSKSPPPAGCSRLRALGYVVSSIAR